MTTNLETRIKNKFKNISTKALIRKIEKAPDFGYDDEAYELSRRLKTRGEKWRWSTNTRLGANTIEICKNRR